MCSVNLDECEAWWEAWVRARKEHRCEVCEGRILPGHRYLDHRSVFDGDIFHERVCRHCERSRKTFANADGHMDSQPHLFLGLLEGCISDDDYDRTWRRMFARLNARLERNRSANLKESEISR